MKDREESALFAALSAWVDVHIAKPDLNLTQDDWCEFWANMNGNPGYEAQGAISNFQSAVLRRGRRSGKTSTTEQMRRRLARAGATTAVTDLMCAGRGLETVEEVCGWIEQRRSHGKTFELFHPGAAGLTAMECRVLDLAQRFLDDRGRPDFVRICQITGSPSRAASLQTLLRARRKVLEHWQRAVAGPKPAAEEDS
jgi:hypothetical protein